MKIRLFDHIVDAHYENQNLNNKMVEKIVSNTVNTWQPDRAAIERSNNTMQGKIAEEIVETFILQHFETKLSMKTYDDIRNDNCNKHAPFDFLLWEKGKVDITPIEAAIRDDISRSQNQFVRLSEYTRQLCKDSNVKIAEVKSTQIRKQLKNNCGFEENYEDEYKVKRLIDEIRRCDDVFCYPHYKRSEASARYSMADYCEYVKNKEVSLANYSGESLRKKVIDLELEHQCSDIFIRVYLDSNAKRGFVVGWIQKEKLLDDTVLLKRMMQFNKSEKALYFTKNLQETKGIDIINTIFERTSTVFANPHTKTNFYHKDRQCKFIRNVSDVEIIKFENEEEAISGGRYTVRCRKCY